MRSILRALMFPLAALLAALPAEAAQGIAFVTDLKGEVSVDGNARPILMSELAAGQKIVLGKDGQLSVMYLQSGKEFALKSPGQYVVGEREIAATAGSAPSVRETAWRTSNQVLVKVAQTSSASIRMRSMAPPQPEVKPRLEFPIEGSVATLQPTLRWSVTDPKGQADVVLSMAGKEDKPVAKSRVSGGSWRVPAKLMPDTEYAWTVTVAGEVLGNAKFRTLPASALQSVEKKRPAEKAEFTDRLMYALMLQELGAVQEAREAWAKLALERADLPELAGLAK